MINLDGSFPRLGLAAPPGAWLTARARPMVNVSSQGSGPAGPNQACGGQGGVGHTGHRGGGVQSASRGVGIRQGTSKCFFGCRWAGQHSRAGSRPSLVPAAPRHPPPAPLCTSPARGFGRPESLADRRTLGPERGAHQCPSPAQARVRPPGWPPVGPAALAWPAGSLRKPPPESRAEADLETSGLAAGPQSLVNDGFGQSRRSTQIVPVRVLGSCSFPPSLGGRRA